MRKMASAAWLLALSGCGGTGNPLSDDQVVALANQYVDAWSAHDAGRVAALFSPDGTLQINDQPPAAGREAVTDAVTRELDRVPDSRLVADGTSVDGMHAVVRWTLSGSSTDAIGARSYVRISGEDDWTIGRDSLLAAVVRHYDEAELARQLRNGFQAGR